MKYPFKLKLNKLSLPSGLTLTCTTRDEAQRIFKMMKEVYIIGRYDEWKAGVARAQPFLERLGV